MLSLEEQLERWGICEGSLNIDYGIAGVLSSSLLLLSWNIPWMKVLLWGQKSILLSAQPIECVNLFVAILDKIVWER